MSTKQTSDLILVKVMDEGVCTVCGLRQTDTQCRSCSPEHYLCNGCSESHKTSLKDDSSPVPG